MNAKECLRHAQECKAKADEQTSETVAKLDDLHKNLVKIFEEKSDLEMKLKVKEGGYQILCGMQEKDMYNQILQKEIDKKRKKIKNLKQELQKKDYELQSALQQLQIEKEELSHVRKELKKKHKEVMQLQREKEELSCSYNIEKEQVSKLVQIMFTHTTDNEEKKVTSR